MKVSEDTQDDSNKGRGLKEEVDALRDEANELLGGLRQIFSASRDEIVRSAALGRLRVDIYQHKKERSALVLSLGEQVYAQVQSGDLKLPGLSELLTDLGRVDALITETQDEIDAGQIASSPPKSSAEGKTPTSKKPAAAKKPSAAKKASASKKPSTAKKDAASAKSQSKKKSARRSGAPSASEKTKKTPGKKGASKTAKGS
jgi:hypothetical protein